jgi:hypothetical protein
MVEKTRMAAAKIDLIVRNYAQQAPKSSSRVREESLLPGVRRWLASPYMVVLVWGFALDLTFGPTISKGKHERRAKP